MPADGLVAGQVGTIVEIYSADAFDVEFLNAEGKTIAVTELHRDRILS